MASTTSSSADATSRSSLRSALQQQQKQQSTLSVSTNQLLCRYGHQCRRKSTCKFVHPESTTKGTNNRSEKQQQKQSFNSQAKKTHSPPRPCPHGLQCWTVNCRKSHPPGWDPKANKEEKRKGGNKTSGKQEQRKQQQLTTSTSSPSPGIAENELDLKGFYVGSLRDADAKGYRAAGILLLRRKPRTEEEKEQQRPLYQATATNTTPRTNNDVQVLLCAEVRKKSQNTLELNLLGGKIEDADGQDPRKTAAREFWEETGQLVSLQSCEQHLGLTKNSDDSSPNNRSTTIWCGPGKYVLYAVPTKNVSSTDPQTSWDNLTHQYAKLSAAGSLPKGAEPDYLVWVDWDLIQSHCSKSTIYRRKDNLPALSFWVPSTASTAADEENSTSPNSLSLKFSFFTMSLLSNHILQEGVDQAIESLRTSTGDSSDKMEKLSSDLNVMEIK